MGSLKNLDTLLEGFIKEDGPAGAGLRVYKGDECLYDRCIGYADENLSKPFAPDTICQMASMTKCIAVTAAMQLYEQGKFLLTDPVEAYIPEFANRQVFDVVDGETIVRPAKRSVTVGNLFDMTSGITVGWNIPGNPNSAALTEATNKALADGTYNIREFAKIYGSTPGAFDPGEHFFYGDSHNVVAALIEVITGKRFSEYLQENIFEPLGIKDMFFVVPEDKKDRVSAMWALRPDGTRGIGSLPPFFYSDTFESACGGLYGTLEDYSRFARCMTNGAWNGVRLLNDRTIRLMAMNRLCPAALADFNSNRTNPYLTGYGYGLGLRTRIEPEVGSNTSLGEFGWTGGWGSWVLMDPTEKISIVYFHQSMPNKEEYIHPRIRNIVYSAL